MSRGAESFGEGLHPRHERLKFRVIGNLHDGEGTGRKQRLADASEKDLTSELVESISFLALLWVSRLDRGGPEWA